MKCLKTKTITLKYIYINKRMSNEMDGKQSNPHVCMFEGTKKEKK